MEVTPSLPVKTVSEFITYTKANPDKVSYASGEARNTSLVSFSS